MFARYAIAPRAGNYDSECDFDIVRRRLNWSFSVSRYPKKLNRLFIHEKVQERARS